MWGEENGKGQAITTDAAGEMRSAGLSAAGIEGDLGAAGDLSAPEDMEGELGGGMEAQTTPTVGGAAPAPIV